MQRSSKLLATRPMAIRATTTQLTSTEKLFSANPTPFSTRTAQLATMLLAIGKRSLKIPLPLLL